MPDARDHFDTAIASYFVAARVLHQHARRCGEWGWAEKASKAAADAAREIRYVDRQAHADQLTLVDAGRKHDGIGA